MMGAEDGCVVGFLVFIVVLDDSAQGAPNRRNGVAQDLNGASDVARNLGHVGNPSHAYHAVIRSTTAQY